MLKIPVENAKAAAKMSDKTKAAAAAALVAKEAPPGVDSAIDLEEKLMLEAKINSEAWNAVD